MNFINFVRQSRERDSLSSILIIVGVVLVGGFIGLVLQLLILALFEAMKSDTFSLTNLLNAISTGELDLFSNWWGLNLSVGASSFFTFTASGLFYWLWMERKTWGDLNSNKPTPHLSEFLIVTLIFLTSAPFVSYIGNINENVKMPQIFKEIESMMRAMEDSALAVTDFLSSTTSISQLLANIVVVGIFAGVGEELIFRGLIQRKLIRVFKNYHWAVWVAALIFSSIHFQFYGFFPRLILGVLFGYLYVWSGNILIPIFAHTLNNSVAVIIGHLISTGAISQEFEDFDIIPFPIVVVTSVLCAFLLFNFSNRESSLS